MSDDLELTKACADAMGLYNSEWSRFTPPKNGCGIAACTARGQPWFDYDPLHDDAQAMALVKRLKLSIMPEYDGLAWLVSDQDDHEQFSATGDNLNRCICEVVAKMHEGKRT